MTLDEKFAFLLEDCVRFVPDFKLSDYDELILVEKFELKELERDARILAALYSGGFDNWEWYSDCLEDLWEDD